MLEHAVRRIERHLDRRGLLGTRNDDLDVLTCTSCQGRMRLLAVVKNPASAARYLTAAGELTEVPGRSPPRAPPYWKSQVLRPRAVRDEGDGSDQSSKGDEAA